jgi:hypothetical protein
MSALPILLTNEGWQRFTEAQLSDDIDLAISDIGFTSDAFVVAPTLTALPGEFKRLATLSGLVAGNDTVHLTVLDVETDTYDLRGFGLYLDDGTLFAVYGQPEPIVEKAIVSAVLLAFDIKFLPALVSEISFGNPTFLYPPATEIRKGVAELATQAEVDAGEDQEKIVTPKTLAGRLLSILGAIADRALAIRTIVGAGLATGGGDLTADRTITVLAASAEEADAGAIQDKALVPASLVNILATLASKAASARSIAGAGLATGGGDLTANRVITVAKASVAETIAGLLDDRAITPAALAGFFASFPSSGSGDGVIRIPGTNRILMYGQVQVSGGASFSFPQAFPSACDRTFITLAGNPDNDDEPDEPAWSSSWTAATFTVSVGSGDRNTANYSFWAIGR